MKKLVVLIAFTSTLFSCNKPSTEEGNKNKLTLAENAYTVFPLETEPGWSSASTLNADNKMDRKKIFSSIVGAVLAGKLKAYQNFPENELTLNEVQAMLVRWDSTNQVEDTNNPGTFISAPIKYEINENNTTQLIFNETIMLDTVSYSINKKVSYVTLCTDKINEKGERIGIKKIFDVKMNN
jgi:hypothetical protein